MSEISKFYQKTFRNDLQFQSSERMQNQLKKTMAAFQECFHG